MKIPCFPITRSSATLKATGNELVREQINQLSSLIDATTVYGTTAQHAEALKASNKMHLLTADMGPKGEYLPMLSMIKNKFRNIFDNIYKLYDYMSCG